MSADELGTAPRVVAEYRGAALRPLLPGLAAMPSLAQPKWAAWRRRQASAPALPEHFADVLDDVAAFVDPVLQEARPTSTHWDPAGGEWVQA